MCNCAGAMRSTVYVIFCRFIYVRRKQEKEKRKEIVKFAGLIVCAGIIGIL